MSHFTTVKNSQLTNKKLLLEGLKNMGFNPIFVEESYEELKKMGFKISQDGKTALLHDYLGNTYQNRYASIVIPREQIGGSANDAGFLWNEESGEFEAVISEFDRRYGKAKPGFGLGEKFIGKLRGQYNKLAVIAAAQAMGMEAIEVEEGKLRVIMSRQKTKPQIHQQNKLQARH